MTIDELLTDPKLDYIIFTYSTQNAVVKKRVSMVVTRAEIEHQNPKQLYELLTVRRNRAVEQLNAN